MDTGRFADTLCKKMTSWFITWKPRSSVIALLCLNAPLLLPSASRPTVSPGFGAHLPRAALCISHSQGSGAPDPDEQGSSLEALSCEEVIDGVIIPPVLQLKPTCGLTSGLQPSTVTFRQPGQVAPTSILGYFHTLDSRELPGH